MIKEFIIEAGKVDIHGDKIDIRGVQIPDRKILLLRDFDVSRPVTKCDVYKDGNVLKAKAELPDDLDGYPAIGFQVVSMQLNKDLTREITEAKLLSVSINSHPNADPSIKRISEQ